jgi:hypothetical protein
MRGTTLRAVPRSEPNPRWRAAQLTNCRGRAISFDRQAKHAAILTARCLMAFDQRRDITGKSQPEQVAARYNLALGGKWRSGALTPGRCALRFP